MFLKIDVIFKLVKNQLKFKCQLMLKLQFNGRFTDLLTKLGSKKSNQGFDSVA